jgi:hypothetical protein
MRWRHPQKRSRLDPELQTGSKKQKAKCGEKTYNKLANKSNYYNWVGLEKNFRKPAFVNSFNFLSAQRNDPHQKGVGLATSNHGTPTISSI